MPMEAPVPPAASSVLFRSASVVLLDIPSTLEESQVLPGKLPDRRIYSSEPAVEPFRTPEPKHRDGPELASPAAQLADLMTGAAVQNALAELTAHHVGQLCSPRILPNPEVQHAALLQDRVVVPESSEYFHGSIQNQRQAFVDKAPKFNLIVMDPPWPNRSARRKTKSGYMVASTLQEIRQILELIPVPSSLQPGGLVAVWITNKASITSLLTSPTGLFASWGLELVAEWTWLKVTAKGEPLYPIDSAWRKPWEKLLIARRIGSRTPSELKDRVIVAVPDVHSRKPNLRGLFQDVLGRDHIGLEVFARNLTAGWWSWGDEVLRFQDAQHWVRSDKAR